MHELLLNYINGVIWFEMEPYLAEYSNTIWVISVTGYGIGNFLFHAASKRSATRICRSIVKQLNSRVKSIEKFKDIVETWRLKGKSYIRISTEPLLNPIICIEDSYIWSIVYSSPERIISSEYCDKENTAIKRINQIINNNQYAWYNNEDDDDDELPVTIPITGMIYDDNGIDRVWEVPSYFENRLIRLSKQLLIY